MTGFVSSMFLFSYVFFCDAENSVSFFATKSIVASSRFEAYSSPAFFKNGSFERASDGEKSVSVFSCICLSTSSIEVWESHILSMGLVCLPYIYHKNQQNMYVDIPVPWMVWELVVFPTLWKTQGIREKKLNLGCLRVA